MARGRSGRRTDYTWFNFGDVELARDLSNSDAVAGSTGFAFSETATITRLRGMVGVTLDAGGVDENAMILCGLRISSADGFSVGTAPEIVTNTADEVRWIWQGSLYVSSGAEASVDGAFPGLVATTVIDSKAMVRIKSTEVLQFIFQNPAALVTDATGTYDLTYFVHGLSGA